jgi:hypothetical protein
MPQDLTCPKCKHAFPVTETRQPFGVQCPACDVDITAEFRKIAKPEPGQPPYELLAKLGKYTAAEIPKQKALKLDDDEDGEKKRKGGSMVMVLVVGVTALLITLGGLGATGYYLFTHLETSNTRLFGLGNSGGGGNRGGNQGGGGGGGGNQPKKEKFELKPVTGTLPAITPAPITADTTIELGGKVGSMAFGGGGRYVVMHFPEQGRLKVFDATQAKITADVEIDAGGNVKIAAGLSRVLVLVPGDIFRVYSLPELAKQFDGSSPYKGIEQIAMGSNTNGPLLVTSWPGKVSLLNVWGNQITEIEAARAEPGHHWNNVRAAPDGTAFATFDGYGKDNKVKLIFENGGQWKLKDLELAPFGGFNKYFYGNGVITDRNGGTKSVGLGLGSNNWAIPATEGDYYLKVVATGTGGPKKKGVMVTIHKGRNDPPISSVPPITDLGETANLLDRFGNLPRDHLDQYVMLVPDAKLLVVMNADRNKLTLRKVDVR